MKKQLTNLINLLFLILTVGFTSCEKATEELPLFDVTFRINNGDSDVVVSVIENETVAEPSETPQKEGSDFLGWYYENEPYDFATPVTSPISIEAKYMFSVGETEVMYQTISLDDFQAMESQKHMLVKAQINYLMFGWAWGTEAYITDPEGHSSKDFYNHSNFGMFSFPLKFTKNDTHIEGQTFVFDLVKDVYMSSPQLGFGYGRNEEFDATGTGAYNGSKWLAPMRYGVEYFDEVVRGNVREVTFTSEDEVKVLIGETEVYIKTLGIEEGTYENVSEDFVATIEALLGQNKFVKTIELDGKVISVLRGEELQFTDNI
ncbi:InlB B-repeat-containing protein [Flammeovirga sp. OC4]|uniref:InlB B-repeat-containing protein n=1 Tax=Flammeovirga sp. OC4 TaxID=1382345 RepID=UPI0005C723CE|nr:InlB B-repeat-containing protein [Flammeovirga sp. OC4]